MSIPEEEWLHLAKRMAVGQKLRFHHGRERRPNMAVGNEVDRYWCYCNACKTGAVVMKDHVKLTGAAPTMSSDLSLPTDMVQVLTAEPAIRDGVLGFVAHKNMDAQYLPELWFSQSRLRVLLQHHGEWLGRDTTERSPQKWLTYNGSNHLCDDQHTDTAVVVEDTFSFFKVLWAMEFYAPVTVYSSLGTKVSDDLMVKLLQHKSVSFMYDGDDAGYRGALKESHRLRACGVSSQSLCAPAGLDPKDMGIAAIREHLR